MRSIGRKIVSWPSVIVLLLFGVTLWSVIVISGIGFPGDNSGVKADLQLHRFAVPPSADLSYDRMSEFLTPQIEKRLSPGGPLRYRFRPNVLRSASEIAPFMLNDGRIASEFANLPEIVALRDAATYGAYARLDLENTGKQPARDLQVRIPGAQAARYWIPERIEPDPDSKEPIEEKFVAVAPKIEKGRFSVDEILPGETVSADVWLARYPVASDWRWAKRVLIRVGETRITPDFHHQVSPVYERLDRNSFMAFAAFAILLTLVGAVTFFYVTSIWVRRGPSDRRHPSETA